MARLTGVGGVNRRPPFECQPADITRCPHGARYRLRRPSERRHQRHLPGAGPRKAFRQPPGQNSPRVGEVVQRGQAEIGIQPISELMEVPGIDIVGPLPTDLQSPDLVYMAGSPAAAEQPVPAKALIDFLAAPAAAPVYKANGMEPG